MSRMSIGEIKNLIYIAFGICMLLSFFIKKKKYDGSEAYELFALWEEHNEQIKKLTEEINKLQMSHEAKIQENNASESYPTREDIKSQIAKAQETKNYYQRQKNYAAEQMLSSMRVAKGELAALLTSREMELTDIDIELAALHAFVKEYGQEIDSNKTCTAKNEVLDTINNKTIRTTQLEKKSLLWRQEISQLREKFTKLEQIEDIVIKAASTDSCSWTPSNATTFVQQKTPTKGCRIFAAIIDGLIVRVSVTAINLIIYKLCNSTPLFILHTNTIVYISVILLYFVIPIAMYGQTVGTYFSRFKIVTDNDKEIALLIATLRTLTYYGPSIAYAIIRLYSSNANLIYFHWGVLFYCLVVDPGFLFFRTLKSQMFHDYIAGTKAVAL